MEINYSTGPRYIDGVNIDIDANATTNIKEARVQIDSSVTDLSGRGYQPGQTNLDGSEL